MVYKLFRANNSGFGGGRRRGDVTGVFHPHSKPFYMVERTPFQ